MSVLVKICGLTRPEDVDAAVAAGADMVGFVLVPSSPRSVTAARAAELAARVPSGVVTVAVLEQGGTPPEPAVTDLVQVYGTPRAHDRAIIASRGEPPAGLPPDVPVLLDLAFGSTPDPATLRAHWRRAAEAGRRVMLAGSLTPANVAEAVRTARPWAVDTARGVEASPGVKDPVLIEQFVTRAKEAAA